MKKQIIARLGLITALSLGVSTVSFAQETKGNNQPAAKPAPTAHSGIDILTISKDSVTVLCNTTRTTYAINSKTKITLDNKTATTDDLKPGMMVVIVSPDGKTAENISADSPKSHRAGKNK